MAPVWIKLPLFSRVLTAFLLLTYHFLVRYTCIGTLLNGPRKRHRLTMRTSLLAFLLLVTGATAAEDRGNPPTPRRPEAAAPASSGAEPLVLLDNGTVQVGVDRTKGGAITHLSWKAHPTNMVNHHDPGRLIQQSYYAGKSLDRIAEGQSKAWSPWPWNPIQGGGIGSWARMTELRHLPGPALFGETVPKLWDMPSEEAAAHMRQWTGFEPGLPDVVVVRCEFESRREPGDRWGEARASSQEIPACYFVRSFSQVKSYLGDGRWRGETQPPGPPWGRTEPPLKAMAMFNAEGQGVAVFSPSAKGPWNFGPHGTDNSTDPGAGPCMHVAPLETVALTPRATYRYRYWLVVGTEDQLARRLDELWLKYSNERSELVTP